jgi:protein SCO1/2
VPPFEFSKSTGGALKQSDLLGKVWVADFIFTSCPGRCPMLTSKMHSLQEAFKSNKNFRLVSVTVDPETDTPAALLAYQKKHGADSEIWYFLTGKMSAIKSLLVSGFHLGTSDRPDFHSSRFALVGADGRIRGLFDVEEEEGLNKLKAEIQHLLN